MKADYVIHLLSRTRDRIQKHLTVEMERQGIQDIAPAHGGVLFALSKSGPVTMSDLADALDRTNSTITTLLDKMESLGYVKRRQSIEDERVFLAELTEKGKAATNAVTKASRKTLSALFKGFSNPEKEEFMRLLSIIHSNLN
ncbi:MarR family transcriptional regulator [Leptospira perolatii]|uniref:MarR family transcriptional regulator n=1 Tax=Leptospira perolatii TaxID=2023191 RepID=A0A2M9ZRF5_9LEPT|nr:MarR family transcriptional regulator [Leptospira perolatii]PJZ71135.1 MarR family transcriptional regulator [Leptospira perolatii]PJZ74667.1 MarR family transcriptional regulator [Leptospira perolatii]